MARRLRPHIALACVAALAGHAAADTPPDGPRPPEEPTQPPTEPPTSEPDPQSPDRRPPPPHDTPDISGIRQLYEARDFLGVRRALLAAYEKTHEPGLLFALGQVEIQLEHYQAAIDYYEKFVATKPPQDQIDLAQQAIAAARLQITKQKPPRHRYWTGGDTALIVIGVAAIGAGAGGFLYGHHKGDVHDGTLTDYDRRLDRARLLQIGSVGLAATGAATIGLALIRWRLRPEDGYEVSATAEAGGGSVMVSGRW